MDSATGKTPVFLIKGVLSLLIDRAQAGAGIDIGFK